MSCGQIKLLSSRSAELSVARRSWKSISEVALSETCVTVTCVPRPHLRSWSDMIECSIERKKERSLKEGSQLIENSR